MPVDGRRFSVDGDCCGGEVRSDIVVSTVVVALIAHARIDGGVCDEVWFSCECGEARRCRPSRASCRSLWGSGHCANLSYKCC
jgi:hypothetical protein